MAEGAETKTFAPNKPTLEVRNSPKKKAPKKVYSASDCTPVIPPENEKEAQSAPDWFLGYAEEFQKTDSVFQFSKSETHERDLEQNPFAFRKNGKVWTGRWIGAVKYRPDSSKTKEVILEVKPRFGNKSVFAMIEEAFSCNIVKNSGSMKSAQSMESLMKLIIPFVWSKKLADANLYGVPHRMVEVVYKGVTIKGRLDVRKSVIPLFRQKEVVSRRCEKQIDEPIAQIILQAFEKLGRGKFWENNSNRLPNNAEEAIRAFESAGYPKRHLTENDYQHIRYKPIYAQYKDVVDFSWQILKSTLSESEGNKSSFTGFLDMAEIWEIYLRSLLRKNFPDWDVRSPEIKTYPDCFWERHIIPDIVLEKEGNVVVFDAKWKQMHGEKTVVKNSDLDQGDFFQIHSYIDYYKSEGKKVVAAGLLYPLEAVFPVGEEMTRSDLWGKDSSTQFLVDGIRFPLPDDGNDDYGDYKQVMEDEAGGFIARIREIIGP